VAPHGSYTSVEDDWFGVEKELEPQRTQRDTKKSF
jgi:hypothetical protein